MFSPTRVNVLGEGHLAESHLAAGHPQDVSDRLIVGRDGVGGDRHQEIRR